jgi:hypothetical protein
MGRVACGIISRTTPGGDDRVDARRRACGGEDGVRECGEVLGFQLDNGGNRAGGSGDFVREAHQSRAADVGRGRGGVVFFEGRVNSRKIFFDATREFVGLITI